MQRETDAGDALEDVYRIHPVVDRLRDLLTSMTALDLKATSKRYWSERSDDGERATSSP